MVNLFFQITPGFIGVHRLEARTFGGVFGGSNSVFMLIYRAALRGPFFI